ncbi:MAG: metallophosphoesterase [Clostridia bacterium]|nr:metallophosphoesterase [Clostridia bacterium]
MKYYVLADPHGFYDIMIKALTEKGFFTDPAPCKLIVCGDLMDRGEGTLEMQRFMTDLLAEGRLIYVRGNHEDLMEQMLWQIEEGQEFRVLSDGTPVPVHNGTWQTALRLAGMTEAETKRERDLLVRRVRESDYYTTLMPASLDYFETEHYVFTHGYIPCHAIQGTTKYGRYKDFYFNANWRDASSEDWKNARWYNGMEFACRRNLYLRDKTVVCGHYTASYGHANIEGEGGESGSHAIYTPFYGQRPHDPDAPLAVIGLDACTVVSGFMNCLVLEDGDLTSKQA